MTKSDTILLVSQTHIHRIERAGSRTASVTESLQRHPEESLAESVGMMLRGSSSRLGRVWIASTNAWVGEIELERRIVFAIGDDGLEDTLAIEAEAISGIPAFSSRTVAVPQSLNTTVTKAQRSQSATTSFLVMQIDASEFDAIQVEIADRQGKLMGIGSAALMAVNPLKSDASTEFACELESATLFATSFAGTNVTHLSAGRFAPDRGHLRFDIASPGPPSPHRLIAFVTDDPVVSDAPQLNDDRIQIRSWDDPESILLWSRYWLSSIRDSSEKNLLIRPIKPPVATSVWTTIALCAAVVTAVICGVWQYHGTQEWKRLAEATELLRQEKAQPMALQRTVATLRSELETLESDLAVEQAALNSAASKTKFVTLAMDAQRTRWRSLFEAIQATTRPDSFIESMSWTTEALRIEGYSKTASSAHEVADELGHRLSHLGWRVAPASTTYGPKGLYRFQLVAQPADPTPSDLIQPMHRTTLDTDFAMSSPE